MELHMIGHASLFIRTQNLAILMDPIFWDPHQEGLFDVFPKREVLLAKIPDVNLIVISHKHLDHFDIRSLAYLPKSVPVIIPKDTLLESYLKDLGFTKIRSVSDFSEITIGATKLLTTRSENPVPEFGMVFSDESGTLWNQVDSVVSAKTVRAVLSRFPTLDLVLAGWQPMLENNYQSNLPLTFPYERYSQILYNIGLTGTKALVPGANAFCYTRSSSWMNHIVFPVSRERFASDAQTALGSESKVFVMDPGDMVHISGDGITSVPSGCQFVTCQKQDRSLLEFSPVVFDGRMRNESLEGVSDSKLQSIIEDSIETDLRHLIETRTELFVEHQRWNAIYQLDVVFDDHVHSWNIDFSPTPPRMAKGKNPLANVATHITASAFYGLITRTRGWDYACLGGHYRSFKRLYSVSRTGTISSSTMTLPDPLELLFPYLEILTAVLDSEVNQWCTTRVETAV